MTTGPLDCDELVELVTAYLDDALELDARATLDLHLLDCDGCEKYLQQFRVTISVLGLIDVADFDPDFGLDSSTYSRTFAIAFPKGTRRPAAESDTRRTPCQTRSQGGDCGVARSDCSQPRLSILPGRRCRRRRSDSHWLPSPS